MNTSAQSIPEHTLASLQRYATEGVPTGSFLRSVLSNDLFGAFSRADLENQRAIGAIVTYVYNEMPSGCWGSREIYHRWIELKRAEREAAEREAFVNPDPIAAMMQPDCVDLR